MTATVRGQWDCGGAAMRPVRVLISLSPVISVCASSVCVCQTVMALIPQVNSEVLELIENLGALKLMIQLRIPAVDDGNNFGGQRKRQS